MSNNITQHNLILKTLELILLSPVEMKIQTGKKVVNAYLFRILMAVLHFNENTSRAQRVGKDGKGQWAISYPKAKGGGATAKEKKVDLTYGTCKCHAKL